jgi:hypothetical protein
MTILKLTAAEVSMLLSLIQDNEDGGWYFGNRDQWVRRRQALKDQIETACGSFKPVGIERSK